MAIWEHRYCSSESEFVRRVLRRPGDPVWFPYHQDCSYCGGQLETIQDRVRTERGMVGDATAWEACPVCGWWVIKQHAITSHAASLWIESRGAVGILRGCDLSDLTIPLTEVRAYLAAKYDARFEMHPRLLEETVASVFRDLGYRVRVTGYVKDGGIDVIMEKTNGSIVGVQIKRYKASINVGQIRELVGALVARGGYTEGVFVTTSSFTEPAEDEARRAGQHGWPIKLIDAKRFFEALGIAQRSRPFRNRDELFESLANLRLFGLGEIQCRRQDGD